MSGAVEGVDIGATLAAADYLISLYERLWKGGAVRDLAEAIGTYERLKLSALTTPPARSYADGVEDAARIVSQKAQAISTKLGRRKVLDEVTLGIIAILTDAAADIRLLSQGGKA